MPQSPSAVFFRGCVRNRTVEVRVLEDRARSKRTTAPNPDDTILQVVRREGGRTFIVDSLLHIRLAA